MRKEAFFKSHLETSPSYDSCVKELEVLANKIADLGLEMPALLFLELHRPLTNIAHTIVLFAEPTFGPLFGLERVRTLRMILANPTNIDILISLLEARSTPKNIKANRIKDRSIVRE